MSRSGKLSVLRASTPAQLAALKSRLRGRICDVVYHEGSATAHEIADQLGKPVTGLYPHLEQLVDAGLLLEGEPVRTTKNFARTFVAPARRLQFTKALADPAVREGVAAIVASQLRLAEREYRSALEAQGEASGRADHRIATGSFVGWLSEAEVREVNALLERLQAIYDRAVPGKGKHRQALSYVSRPVAE